jgi:hypothetical protein
MRLKGNRHSYKQYDDGIFRISSMKARCIKVLGMLSQLKVTIARLPPELTLLIIMGIM